MTAVVVFGNLWFRLVESLLERVRRRFFRRKTPQAWHPLPPDPDETDRTDQK